MMENLKITHIDWKAIEDKYGNRPLTEGDVCALLRMPRLALQNFLRDGSIHYSCTPPGGYFSLEEVKSFATKVLGIKDGSYIHDTEQQEDDKEKLAKRFELRKRIYKILNSDKPYWESRIDFEWNELEIVFNWIYESPMIEWEGKIYCFTEIFNEGLAIDYIIQKSKDLYNKLK